MSNYNVELILDIFPNKNNPLFCYEESYSIL